MDQNHGARLGRKLNVTTGTGLPAVAWSCCQRSCDMQQF